MSRNSCFPRKELLSSIFFKIVSRDKNINAIRENSEISERIETPQHLSKSPRKLFEGLLTNALHFPDDQTSYFSIETSPKSIPFWWTPRNIRIDNVRATVKEIRRSPLNRNREEFQGLRRGRNARRILR